MEPYYPVNNDRNNALAEEYRKFATLEKDVLFGGRLGQYKYFDMAPIIEQVLNLKIL
jgi:UDP-galactopyranose mutase